MNYLNFLPLIPIAFFNLNSSFAMNNDQENRFSYLPRDCIHLIVDYCNLENVSQMTQVDHACNQTFNSVISNPLFLDRMINDLNKIDTFSVKKLKFLLSHKSLIKERLLEKIRDQDLKAFSNFFISKKNLNINYARLAAFKMKVLLYLMNTKTISTSIFNDITLSIVLDFVKNPHWNPHWNPHSNFFPESNHQSVKKFTPSHFKVEAAKQVFYKESTRVAHAASLNSAWSNDLDDLLNNELKDPILLAAKFPLRLLKTSIEEHPNIKQVNSILKKLEISTLSSLANFVYDYVEIMTLYFFLENRSHLFMEGSKRIYNELEKQNLPFNSSIIDDRILEHLTDNRISGNEWIIEFNQFLNDLDQVFNLKRFNNQKKINKN